MQPSSSTAGGVRRVRADVQETPLNVEGWWRRGEGGVPADQVRDDRLNRRPALEC
jgi:hypothetical protein